MKNPFKTFEILSIAILLFSCNNNESEVSQKDFTQGYWKLSLTDETSNQNAENKIYFQFDNNVLNVYIQENKNSFPFLVEQYPVLIQKNEIILHNPLNKNEIISNIKINEDGHFLEKNVRYIESNFGDLVNKKFKTLTTTNGWLCDYCMKMCERVHAALNISQYDIICCVYIDGCNRID